MKCLFLDLASHDSLIACCDGSAVVASESVHARISDADLVAMTESVLKKAGWSYGDLDRIACVIGPGGFTSLRVAVTFANVLRDQLGIEVAGVHLSDLYRARCDRPDVYWMHSTKKDQLFVRGGQWEEPTLISIHEKPDGAWMGELIDEHNTSEPVVLLPVQDVLPSFLASQTYNTELLTPWYGRGW